MTIKFYDLVGADPDRPFSPHCWKVRMALAQKGLEFEQVPVRFPEIAAIENGGYSTVPVIRHGANIIADSFDIAVYLADDYPDQGGHLFRGPGSRALSKFVESWSQTRLHPWCFRWAVLDIHAMLSEEDQKWYRKSREKRVGKTLEEFAEGREHTLPELQERLAPMHMMLKSQPFIGGQEALFADYVVFGVFQWLRITSGLSMIAKDDPVRDWLERMLDLHGGLGRSVAEGPGQT